MEKSSQDHNTPILLELTQEAIFFNDWQMVST